MEDVTSAGVGFHVKLKSFSFKFCCELHLTFSKTRCGCVAFYHGCMSPLGISSARMMLIVVSSDSLLRVVFCFEGGLRLSLSFFLSFAPSPFGPVGSLWGGGGSGRQGTSGLHPRLS